MLLGGLAATSAAVATPLVISFSLLLVIESELR